MSRNKYRYFIGLFLTSLTLFFNQLLLNRLFSVILSNQYSYLVISFSIMGLGIGEIWTYFLSKKIRINLNMFVIIYLMSCLGSITVIFLMPYLGSPIWYILLGMLPFISGGAIISYLFKTQPNTYQVYLIDLVGGVAGLLTGMLLMNYTGTIQAIVILYFLVILIPMVLNNNKISLIITIVLSLGLILGSGNIVSLYQNSFNSFFTTPYAHFEDGGEYRYSNWDAFARTDAYWRVESPDEMMIGLNGRSFSRLVKFDGDLSKVQYLKNEIGYLPFEINNPEKVAIIGSGGGEEIIFSFLAGINDITAVEINSGTIAATRELADFSGKIYDDPRVRTVIGDGRSYIRKTDQKYDQIYIALVMTNIGDDVANTLSENFIYTQEALGDYFSKLKPGGNVSFLFHSSTDLLKMLTTAITYFENSGINYEQISDHFIIFAHKNSVKYPVLLVSPEPFSKTEVKDIVKRVVEKGFMPIHLPGLVEEHSLHLYREGEISVEDIVHNFPADIAPISDDRPFFYNVQKGLPKSLLALVLGAFILLLLVFLLSALKESEKKNEKKFYLNYLIFTFLGMAFMFVEITLIQKMSVFLEHPTTSFVTIITLLLLGAGLGNFVQLKKELFHDFKPVIYLVFLALVEIIVINRIIYLGGFDLLAYKIAITTLLLLPLGFLMGIPFPMVLGNLRKDKAQNWIPYFWGVNGIASVLGSGLTMITSLSYGFNVSFIIGVILYLSIGLLLKRLE